jgi:hypothetical protein
MNTRTRKSLDWFGPPERNILLHCVLYCLREPKCVPFSTLHASPFIVQGGMYKGSEPRYMGPGTNGRMELLLAMLE